jgi:TorA maturation chaperone TorD
MTTTAPITFGSTDDSEELARAELYGLLAQLWLAPPDETLLQQFRVAVTEAPQPGGWLEAPWHDLVGALRATTPTRRRPNTALFLAWASPRSLPTRPYHLTGFLNESRWPPCATTWPRWACRATAGLETEDHIAYLFEVMRYLIAGDDMAVCNLEQQRRFFRPPAALGGALCDSTVAHPRAEVWRAVASSRASSCRSKRRASTCSSLMRPHRPAMTIPRDRSPASSSAAAAAAAWAASTRACRATTACRWRCTRCCGCQPQVGELMINANRNLAAYESMGVPVWPDPVADYAGPLAGWLAGAGALRHALPGGGALRLTALPHRPGGAPGRSPGGAKRRHRHGRHAGRRPRAAASRCSACSRPACWKAWWPTCTRANARSTAGRPCTVARGGRSKTRWPLPTPTRWKNCSACRTPDLPLAGRRPGAAEVPPGQRAGQRQHLAAVRRRVPRQ